MLPKNYDPWSMLYIVRDVLDNICDTLEDKDCRNYVDGRDREKPSVAEELRDVVERLGRVVERR